MRALLATPVLALIGTPAAAQVVVPTDLPPVAQAVDDRGVDVVTRKPVVTYASISLGAGPGRLGYNLTTSNAGQTEVVGGMNITGNRYSVTIGSETETFTLSGGSTYTQDQGSGSTLSYSSTTQEYTYTRSDGSVAVYGKPPPGSNPTALGLYLLRLTYPAGERLDYYYEYAPVGSNHWYRRLSVTSSSGYQLRFAYLSSGTLTNVTAFNMADETCAPTTSTCTLTGTWPNLNWDASGNVTESGQAIVAVQAISSTQTKYVYPTGRTLTYNNDTNGRVTSVTDGKGTWTYSHPSPYGGVTTIFQSDYPNAPKTVSWGQTSGLITNENPAAGVQHTSYYTYDSKSRMTKVVFGSVETQFTYDSRGNVTEARRKSTTPGTPADILMTAGFPASCSAQKTCNKPEYTIDARQQQTDYTYDPNHGGLLTVTRPAAPGGVRPQTRYGYGLTYANYRDGNGNIVSGPSFYRLTSISECATTASCAGTADEIKTTFAYDPAQAGLPTSVTTGAGDGSLSATTTITYTGTGQVKTIDGPLAGSADTTRYYYDAADRLIGEIGPDPDGGGPLSRRAVRTSYNAEGQVVSVEVGTASGQVDGSMATFAQLQRIEMAYDAQGRRAKEALISGSTTHSVQQFAYTNMGFLKCTAVRMNLASFGSLPASACDAATSGSDGPDRITSFTHDPVGRFLTSTMAVGTDAQSTEATVYDLYGQVTSVTDAESNKTSFEYDAFRRPFRTFYPSASTKNTSSATDYEEFEYDPGSNLTRRRVRDGSNLYFSYDNLSRLVAKDTPNAVNLEWDVAYTHDLIGRLTTAIGNGWAVNAFSYDALGRMTTEQNYNATTYHAYDLAGRQTRLTWSDGFYADYEYNLAGEMTVIRENGGTTNPGVLATYEYDNLGRRTLVNRGNGSTTTYSYDGASRLLALSQDLLGGSAYDFTHSFIYNPAHQVTSVTRSNDAYAWGGHYNVDRTYAINGLNQVTAAGAVALTHDGRGNVATIGSAAYGYTTQNQMATAPDLWLAYEPAGGQLLQYQTGSGADTRFAWSGSQMVAEIDASTWTIARRYVPGPGIDEPVVWYEGSGTSDRRWLHADERGSVVAITNGSGVATALNTYDEYGIPASTNVGRFQYTGQAWMPELGMYYYKARIYSPTLGRFMQTDPIGYAVGLNLYNYVDSDPVNSRDSTGLCGISNGRDLDQSCGPAIVVTGQISRVESNGARAINFTFVPLPTGFRGLGSPTPLTATPPELQYGQTPPCPGRAFAQRSPADDRLFKAIYADRTVQQAMKRALGHTAATGNEASFWIYRSGDGFRVGTVWPGSANTTNPRAHFEYLGGPKPIAGFHTHPGNGRIEPSQADVNYARTTGTLSIIGNPNGIIAGRRCQ